MLTDCSHSEPTSTDVGGTFFGMWSQGTAQAKEVRSSAPSTFALPVDAAAAAEKHTAAEFKRLARKWKDETQFLSSPAQKYLNPSYARVIGMGKPAVKHILQGMTKEYGDWFYALRAITNADPVTADMAGDIPRMTAAWIKWGKSQGIL